MKSVILMELKRRGKERARGGEEEKENSI